MSIEIEKEFKKGDIVHFQGYNKYPIKAKVLNVFNNFMFEDSRITYELSGINSPLNTKCTGNSIMESKYFNCLDKLFIYKNLCDGKHYIVACHEESEAINSIEAEFKSINTNNLELVNTYNKLLAFSEEYKKDFDIVSTKKLTNNMYCYDLPNKEKLHVRVVLEGLCCHITHFDRNDKILSSSTTNKDLFDWWRENQNNIIVIEA